MSILKNIFSFVAGFLTIIFIVLAILWRFSPSDKTLQTSSAFLYNMQAGISAKELSFEVENTNFKKQTMNDFKEDIMFVNFWATWCGPCIAEMPSIDSLRQNLQGKSIRFILISQEDIKKVVKFKQKKDFNLDFYVVKDETLPKRFKKGSIPYTVILHKNKVIYEHLGSQN